MASDKQNVCGVTLTLLVVCVGLTLTQAQWVVDDDGCRTPRRGVGTCVAVRSCKPMIDFIEQSPTLSQSAIEILRSYQCGYEGNSVKVCCPVDGQIVIGKPSIPTPPDVSNHRNLNLLPSDCGTLPTGDRIIGGNKTVLYEFPWMALLSYQTANGVDFRCGGSIINDRYILTAAHCIAHLTTLKLIGVRVGEYNISSPNDCERDLVGSESCAPPVQDLGIEESIPHPNYDKTVFTYDIGLIRLSSPINTAVENAKPICLPSLTTLRNQNLANQNLIVTGWGATETGRKSADLLKVEVPVTTEENCRKAYEKSPAKINYRQICAGGKSKRDSCGGDSGGPLQKLDNFNNDARFVQHGIVSFGPRFCGQEGFPGVYTRIDYYMDWILDNMKP